MANYKKKDHYYIVYDNGERFEVPEDIYRAWTYFTNQETKYKRDYHSHTICNGDHVYSKPSRFVSIHEESVCLRLKSKLEDPQENFERKTQQKLLREMLDALPANYKPVIYFVYFTNYSEVEASKILGICQSSFHGRKERALAWLRKYCDQNGIGPEDFSRI